MQYSEVALLYLEVDIDVPIENQNRRLAGATNDAGPL